MDPLPDDLAEGHFPVLLVAGSEELEVRRIHHHVASPLEVLEHGGMIGADDAGTLVDAGLATAPLGFVKG